MAVTVKLAPIVTLDAADRIVGVGSASAVVVRREQRSDRGGTPAAPSRRGRRTGFGDERHGPGADRGALGRRASERSDSPARASLRALLERSQLDGIAVDASGARTRSLTVVSVSSAMRRSRGRDGVVTPRSQRDTVIDSTPSSAASCFWVRPTLRLAMRSRPPTPPPSWVPTNQSVDNRRVGRLRRDPLTRRQRSERRTRFPHRSQRW